MQAFYDSKPPYLEAVGNGSYVYRFNIEEVVTELTEENAGEEKVSQWKCEEVKVWAPLSSNKITEAAISNKWERNYEQKLVNEYNSAQLGLFGTAKSDEAQAKITAYKDFLTERAALKAQVDADCAELGII